MPVQRPILLCHANSLSQPLRMLILSFAMNIPFALHQTKKVCSVCPVLCSSLSKSYVQQSLHDPKLLNEKRQILRYPSQSLPSQSRTEYKVLWFAVGYWYVLSIGPGAVVIGALGLLDEPTLMLVAERFGFRFVNPCEMI